MSTEDTSAKLLKQMEKLMGRMKIWKTDLSSKVRLFLIRRKFLPIRKALLITIFTIPEAVAEGMVRVIIDEVIIGCTKVVTLKDVLITNIHREEIEVVAAREVIPYWQVEVDEADKHKTAFTVGNMEFFECNRMGFGLANAPATFQRLIEHCMGEMNLKECLIFLDDIIIFSETFEEYISRLEAVFSRLKEHSLKIKPSKCKFFKSPVRYLGHVVSEQGVQTDPDNREALASWPEPSSIKELRSFLGFTGYYRRFIKDYARIVKPLNDLLIGHHTNKSSDRNQEKQKKKKKKIDIAPWQWGQAQQLAFNTLRGKLSYSPVLAYADFKKPFIVHTDASLEGLGAILYQEQEGKERVITYASRGLRNSEKHYPAHKLEFLCLK